VTTLLDELAFKRSDYDLGMLLEIHKLTVDQIVSPDKVGVLRTTQVIIKDELTGEVILTPPPFVQVPFMLEDFFEWVNSQEAKEIHPVLRAGISHYILVAIHPFVEGNGRSVRAFATLIMLREGYDIKKFFSLEEHFDANPAAYYEAFALVDRQSKNIGSRDLTSWLEYFTFAVATELTKIKDKIRKLSMDTRLRVKIGEQVSLSERQMKLVEYLTNQGSAVMKDLWHMLPMVSEDTVLRDLKGLIDKGIIKKEGTTKASRYVMVK
jgi:Fic family protein